ncbi:hypothetical protein CPJCM30710_20830 [Clostridium polyendosporum]|uniref:Uncharacterized protein n=1 Tax=Clostridium polyendosporum TaxID=69208 RepID=A0A919VGQ1_9CLOT|nr:hypothetical protein [Clostridium polyendosporum]GIM29417.1 hypothetical protein CPJCM30710_20830 [Clostridium polyendosporum]
MYFSYPEEYIFPVIMKDNAEFNFIENFLDEVTVRKLDNSTYNRLFNEIDEEFIAEMVRK